ncbi:hypothetical protein KP509_07G099200 [Ceratopteris richardii]|uniref:DUF7876 domain-containing protein n=1 Tax=Ceratopteris richardii TaxID=49495 RepID=A0A8T2UCT0_CERRI|nr:hypothetical protein KP509_07G099200 [Ceratopteris richardii]
MMREKFSLTHNKFVSSLKGSSYGILQWGNRPCCNNILQGKMINGICHLPIRKQTSLDFITAGVTAYAVGCTEEGLRDELLKLRDSSEYSMEQRSSGVTTSVKLKLTTEEINECILWSVIVFITILCTPQPTVVRWSNTPPVSDEAQLKWRGFCALIANAYYTRGMAWLPIKTLQLEQMAVMGHAEEPAIVADRMRLVFATLENVSPQWPKG